MLSLLLLALACAPKPATGKADAPSPLLQPRANIFLRTSFDKDPSMYIGRFLPNDVATPDETTAMTTRCSPLVTSRYVEAGGTTRDEFYRASLNATASLGINSVLAVGGGTEMMEMVRVKYTEVGKLVAIVPDPGALEDCCKRAPDQCTSRYVGEFLMGHGSIDAARSLEANAGVKGVVSGTLPGKLEAKGGYMWEKATEFPNDVYFAFSAVPVAWAAVATAPGCGPWTDQPPKSAQGQYFVGLSELVGSEKAARDLALKHARVQAVQWASEQIQVGSIQVSGVSAGSAGLEAFLSDTTRVETAAAGVATLMKDENWCLQSVPTPDGIGVIAKVLAFLPNESAATAAKIVGEGAAGR